MVFVVAEIGVNWDGNFDLVKSMMTNAKEAGCNAVKFQAFDETIVKEHPEKSRLMSSSISNTNVETIDRLAKSVGIEWFCTPMYLGAVDILEPYVSKFKIREFDGRQLLEGKTTGLLERVLKTGKEVFVSSQRSPKGTKYFGNKLIKWLYVIPKYPCELSDLDFRNIREFDGFSNHCPQIIAPLVAAIMGSNILEIHLTSDKSKNFIDNNVSFDYKDFEEMIHLINLAKQIKV